MLETGLEPVTFALLARRSNRLSYTSCCTCQIQEFYSTRITADTYTSRLLQEVCLVRMKHETCGMDARQKVYAFVIQGI